MEDDWAIKAIVEQRDKIQRLRDEAEGKLRLFDENGNAVEADDSYLDEEGNIIDITALAAAEELEPSIS